MTSTSYVEGLVNSFMDPIVCMHVCTHVCMYVCMYCTVNTAVDPVLGTWVLEGQGTGP